MSLPPPEHPHTPPAGIEGELPTRRFGGLQPPVILTGEAPAIGRARHAVEAIEQQVVDSQQALERSYWERRRAHARQERLAAVALDAVLLVDADSLRVLDINPAASALFGIGSVDFRGRLLRPLIESSHQSAFDELLRVTCSTGSATEASLRVAAHDQAIEFCAWPAQTDGKRSLLLRGLLALARPELALGVTEAAAISDGQGRLLCANPGFAALCDGAVCEGRSLAELLGDPQDRWPGLLARVRARSLIGQERLALGFDGAPPSWVALSANLLSDADQEQVGYTLRPLASFELEPS